MKKVIYAFMLSLVVLSGLVLSFAPFNEGSDANPEVKNETAKEPIQKRLLAAEIDIEMKKREATPAGIQYKKWEASPAGKKVDAAETKIWKHIKNYTNMEGVVTSLSLPPGSKLGLGVMVKVKDENYILTFDAQKSQLEPLHSLKVNDKIIIKSHNVSHAPKYAYPIISCGILERDSKVIFKRIPRKGGC